MKRPIILDTEWVRPIGSSTESGVCMTCSEFVARWAIGKPPNGYLSCARCFLYTSPWGKSHRTQIDELVAGMEEARGVTVSIDGVVVGKDADAILFSIVGVSGIIKSKRRSYEGSGA